MLVAADNVIHRAHTIETLVDQAERNLPADRLQTLAYDKAADDGKVHEMLHDRDIKPVIENRTCRPKDGEQEKVIGDRVPLHVVHDEAGTVFCYDTTGATPVRRAMSYADHEKDRGTLKYRCPRRWRASPAPATRSATQRSPMA